MRRIARLWTQVAVLLSCLPGAVLPLAADAPSKPNIILILADDLGWGDLACQGHPCARTPNLDRLAAEGTRFTECYATGVTCCPARTGLMTGKLPATFQKYPAAYGFGERVTVTELLNRQGYVTGHFGKWHIGPDPSPGAYGIDVIHAKAEPGAARRRAGDSGRDSPIFDAAIRFIEDQKGAPFYLNVWGHIPHHPIDPAQPFVDEFAGLTVNESEFSGHQREKFALVKKAGGDVDDAMRRYLGDVYSLDQDVGRLLAKVDELGLRHNTLVVFSSDQGAAPVPDLTEERAPSSRKQRKRETQAASAGDRARLALNSVGYAGPQFRGGKHTDFEGGVRVPFLVRWPGRIPEGRIDEASVLSGADWLPTLCAIAGVPIDPANFDGEDVSAAWFGGVHERASPLFWKTSASNSDAAMRWQNWKFHGSSRRRGDVALYDLASDPGEMNNLATQLPEVVAGLTSRLEAWTAALPATYAHGDAEED